MTCKEFVKILKKLETDPSEAVYKEYERAYKQALKDNPQCVGYCENPYGCNGGCYEY